MKSGCHTPLLHTCSTTPVIQIPITATDSTMAWHKGTWWPLYVKEWYAPKSSQHMFDPYSFCLLVLGLVFHLLWGTEDIDQWIYGFLLALGLELVWEIVGNTQVVLRRIRENNGTSGEYIGNAFLQKFKLLMIFS